MVLRSSLRFCAVPFVPKCPKPPWDSVSATTSTTYKRIFSSVPRFFKKFAKLCYKTVIPVNSNVTAFHAFMKRDPRWDKTIQENRSRTTNLKFFMQFLIVK